MLKSSKEVTAHVPLFPSPQSCSLEAGGDGKPAMCPAAIWGQDHVPQVGGALRCPRPRPTGRLVPQEGLGAAA